MMLKIYKTISYIFLRVYHTLLRSITEYLSRIVPKDESLWLYYPVHFKALAGDCMYLFDYVKSNGDHVRQFILVDFQFKLTNSDYDKYLVNRYTLRGMLLSLRAKFIIIDADGPFKNGKFNLIQLWHGTGYKNIVALSGTYSESYNKNRLENICFVPASSEHDKKRKIKSFLTNNVTVTGSPRNDFFFSTESTVLATKLRVNLGLNNYKKIILFAPTYRKNKSFRPFSVKFFKQFQKAAEINNFVLLIKKHPKDHTVYSLKEYNNIRDITSQINDIQNLLLITDTLITDYSSIASDFALLNRPIVFYTYDFDEYIKNQRGFYYDLRNILPGPFAENETELLGLLTNSGWFTDSSYIEKFREYQNMFHHFKDGKSSKRVYDAIRNRFN